MLNIAIDSPAVVRPSDQDLSKSTDFSSSADSQKLMAEDLKNSKLS
jgi:hypothetical protein